jgi:two-component system, sensor histidine kinase and response regulator
MTDQKINILYLDDEEHNLQSFKAAFRREYNIYTTTNSIQAEEILEEENIQIILADQRMPKMTGVQFFEKIRDRHHEPLRILITGYSDITVAIDAINKGEVFRFIDKPWDFECVKNTIGQAYDIYKTRTDLRQRNLELQKANEELDKFVYSASHDLRAPLMSIQGVVNLAKQKQDANGGKHYFDLIEQCVQKLDEFILTIIDYYKNSRGVPIITEVNFNELMADIVSVIKFMPGFDRIKINTDINEVVPFRSDIVKLRIIFNNLLTNAVKFRDEKKPDAVIDIKIDVTEESCHVVFHDNGIGIKESQLKNMFKMFHKGAVKNSGSGIGLYIVHEAVKKLDGSINVFSVYGEGTTFELRIPQKQ